MPTSDSDVARSAWPSRLALATLCAAVPLVFFGGTVTTLHAGLAIDGWLVLEPGRGDHFLWFYPVEKWFRDTGTFVEHTHRQIGSLVGLLAIATVIATFLTDRRRGARWIAVAALLAVIAQGVLGGLRVLERSTDLAFLHGSLGQAVFALLGASAIVLSPGWRRASSVERLPRSTALRSLSLATVCVVYAQIVIGAWLRHGGSPLALVLHVLTVVAVVLCVWLTARELRRAASETDASHAATRSKLERLRLGLLAVLGAQLVLGVLAFLAVYVWVGRNPTQVEQALFPTLHVMGGAVLLAMCVATAMWTRHLESAQRGARSGAVADEAIFEPSRTRLESAR